MSKPVISSGQITIIDLYDAPSLNAWISSSLGDSQLYDNTAATWSPNYTTGDGQTLTLHLTRAGSSEDLIGSGNLSNVVWQKSVGPTTSSITSTSGNEYVSGTDNSVLNVKKNIPKEQSSVSYTASGTWIDSEGSGLPVEFSAKISLDLIQLAKAAVVIDTNTPNGYFFKNDMPDSLTIEAFLYKDGAISEGSKTVKWFEEDTTVRSDSHTKYDKDAGTGWAKITNTSSTGEVKTNIGFGDTTTSTTPTLTIYPDNVVNGKTYQVILTDQEGGNKGMQLRDFVTIMDFDDPIQVVIDSTGGGTFKNGIGQTDLTAMLYKNGQEVDPWNAEGNYQYTYTWTKYENNKLDPNFGTEGEKTGKRIQVGSADVNGKAVFDVAVREG